jgi:hypothetical protein
VVIEAFLICALALPAANYTQPPIVSWQAAKSEEDRLKDWLKKNHDVEDVFITPRGQSDKLKEYGWERVPFKWKDLEIWIQRKPRSDRKQLQEST